MDNSTDMALLAVTRAGLVDGACFSSYLEDSAWIAEMKRAGMIVVEVSRDVARRLLFTQLPVKDSSCDPQRPGRMIVGRRGDGTVEAAGWDYMETRRDACGWLDRGLSLELLSARQVAVLAAISPGHIFDTKIPVGDVLTNEQALQLFAGA